MRITFIVPAVNLGGGSRVTTIYAQRLMQKGHVVQTVSLPPRTLSIRQKLKAWLKGDRIETGPPRSHFNDNGIDYHVIDRRRPITDGDVPDADVVIATWWETAEWVNALSAGKGAKVYFVQGHEGIFRDQPAALAQATYRLPLHKIVVARWLKDVMRTQYGDDVVDVVPNSVDRSQFFAPVRGKQPVPTVGFLYSRSANKGLDRIDAALRMIRKSRPDLRVIAFGNGRPIPQWPLPERTEFHFSPPQDRIRDIYASCDVWVAASETEGFNLPTLEAMTCRTPLVSTKTGWPEEAIKTGWNGVLVEIGDVDGIAKGIEWVLSRTEDEWRTLSANAYAAAATGSWEESTRLFEKALEHACQRAARGEIAGRCLSTPRERGA